ncbi:MAG TPA: hypothetical protein VFG47_03590 [Geminicoccaceae bacterium]|nr:hypothetical protein [Geminicoccaceae bacterium]
MDETRPPQHGPRTDSGTGSPPRKVGLYDQARERVRSGGMSTGVIAAIAVVILLIILWMIFT